MYVGQDRPDDVFSRQRYHAAVCRSVALRFQICDDDHDDDDDDDNDDDNEQDGQDKEE